MVQWCAGIVSVGGARGGKLNSNLVCRLLLLRKGCLPHYLLYSQLSNVQVNGANELLYLHHTSLVVVTGGCAHHQRIHIILHKFLRFSLFHIMLRFVCPVG